MAEKVRRPPKKAGARRFHLVAEVIDDLLEVAAAFGKCRAFGAHVGVVEAEERHAKDREHLERHVGLELRQSHAVAEPRPVEGLPAERVAAGPGKAVPVGDGETQMILHPLAQHHLVRIVVAKGEVAGTLRPLVEDLRDSLEKVCHVRSLSADCVARKRA